MDQRIIVYEIAVDDVDERKLIKKAIRYSKKGKLVELSYRGLPVKTVVIRRLFGLFKMIVAVKVEVRYA